MKGASFAKSSPAHWLLAAACAAALAALAGCARSDAEPKPAAGAPPEVLTAPARAADADYALNLPARALAGESAQLYARATGLVSERRADLGDQVAAGQVLAVISTPEVDSAVREAQAEVLRARASEELARTNYQRAEVLVKSNAISKEMYSDRMAARDAAAADRTASEARLASARERQGFQVVRAPFEGVIAARNVERGDRVVGDSAATASPLFTVNVLDPLRVVVDVPQSAALQVRPGLRAEVRFPELPGETFPAEVIRSAQSISSSVGAMRVELRLPNPGNRIPAGMVGEVKLSVPRTAAAVIVPESAVITDAGGTRVALLDAASQLAYRQVKLGRNLGGEIEIIDGVAAGEQIVLAPNALLKQGMRVVARKNAKPAA
ncbi:efflux RND transporter periplasmic adaptor subunit [Luteimonas aquatica]|uniref:efflux RND transporter periplasmic adaptor subunit n=1 Tax=Luteimonas aquatica TaxID=450364 RepID=UPI001F579AA5|nr:efflux RND transporter periplasmic adaptor subunit [Luteimonas aquatica]